MIIALSIYMVGGMAFFMSFYGLGLAYLNNSLYADSIAISYSFIFSKNIVFAIPLQLIIIGPLVRYLFTNLIKGKGRIVKIA